MHKSAVHPLQKQNKNKTWWRCFFIEGGCRLLASIENSNLHIFIFCQYFPLLQLILDIYEHRLQRCSGKENIQIETLIFDWLVNWLITMTTWTPTNTLNNTRFVLLKRLAYCPYERYWAFGLSLLISIHYGLINYTFVMCVFFCVAIMYRNQCPLRNMN